MSLHAALRARPSSRALLAGLTAAVLMSLAACGGSSDGAAAGAPDQETSSNSATPTSPASESPTAEPDPAAAFAVEAPGKRTEQVAVGDILISAEKPIPRSVIKKIAKLDGVVAVADISLADVSVENTVYRVAAVDPADYRRFTSGESPDFQAQWNRVAAGEAAVASDLEDTFPTDSTGSVRLGTTDDDAADLVHVGAYAPQVEQIDVVVNRKRGKALGMEPRNALIVSTGLTAPETLRQPIRKIVGADPVIQNLDAAARYGLDPSAFQSVMFYGSFAEAVGTYTYTPTADGKVIPEPSWVSSHISTETMPILGAMTCNSAMMPQLRAALEEIEALGLADEIHPDEYAGCYYPRFIASSTTLSNHSFGLAFDINVPGNERGTVGAIDRGVVAVFKRWGFAWGGDWKWTDPMHFELQRIVRPG